MRKRLIEILNTPIFPHEAVDPIEAVADYLIDSGVVPVVRCKDCKYRRDDEDYVCGHYCVKRPHNGGYFCEDDDYCSYGERKDDV